MAIYKRSSLSWTYNIPKAKFYLGYFLENKLIASNNNRTYFDLYKEAAYLGHKEAKNIIDNMQLPEKKETLKENSSSNSEIKYDKKVKKYKIGKLFEYPGSFSQKISNDKIEKYELRHFIKC